GAAAATPRPVDGAAAGLSAERVATGWLRSWRIVPPVAAGGRRSLVLDFAAPVGGAWQVNLQLVPREPLAAAFPLPFPSAAGIQMAPPVFAWRARGVE